MASIIETLWIPEKPSVAKELTAALARIRNAKVENIKTVMSDGFYMLSSGDAVCSTYGHMLQMLPPSRYLTKAQNSDLMSVLPLIPDVFKFEPQPERSRDGKIEMKGDKPLPSKRFTLLEKLFKQAKTVVNACDIDREGQLIFDEMLVYWSRDPYGSNIKRATIVSMTPEALDKSVRDIEPNGAAKWLHRGQAASTRQKMDWLLGMNASMAYQVVSADRTISVGRVQTPVLAMVVKRDLEIENFKPQKYHVPVVVMSDGTKLRWEKRIEAEGQEGFDANGRIVDAKLAQTIIDQIKRGLPGTVIVSSQEEKKESPPPPFSMGSLQSDAAKQHGLSIAEVDQAAANLYLKHKSISYIGTDNKFLPEAMHDSAGDVIGKLSEQFKIHADGANPRIKSKAFNNDKVDEHYAIVPTGIMPNFSASEHAEKCVYETIVKRFLAQFYPDYRAQTASLVMMFGHDEFRATASKDLEMGWKTVEGIRQKTTKASATGEVESKATVENLSEYVVGQVNNAAGAEIAEGTTTPPPRYSEDSLIRDMENASKFAKTPEEKKMLKETEGIGTARTRGPTLTNLIKRQFLISKKSGKKYELTSSPRGREIVGRLPPWLTDVGTTAKWETMLAAIQRGEVDPEVVLQSQIANVRLIVDRAKTQITKRP